jgi:hypothetical protein
MDQFDQLLEIRLDDGRVIICRPRPEDQDYLRQAGGAVTLELGSSEFDTAAHGLTGDLTIDVEGHAMTLRLPTPADAEALRRMLMLGAISATIVAAGAIASLQGVSPTTSGQSIVAPPPPAGAAQHDFGDRREQAIDQMLEAPGVVAQPGDIQVERLDRINTPAGPARLSVPQSGSGSSRADFRERREQAADELLEAPAAEAPAQAGDQGGSQPVGGPQD